MYKFTATQQFFQGDSLLNYTLSAVVRVACHSGKHHDKEEQTCTKYCQDKKLCSTYCKFPKKNTPPSSKRQPSSLTPKFLHGYFSFVNAPYRASSDNALSELLVFIDYVLNTSTKNCYILVHYLPPRLLLLKLEMNLCEVVPCHHDDVSCFDASRISVNKSVGDFPWYMFREAAVLPESPDCRPRAPT